MRVMVIGGNGFLGAHIVRQLVEKAHTVSVFDISPINRLNDDIAANFVHVQGDVTEPAAIISAVKEHAVEYVVHLASMVTLASQMQARWPTMGRLLKKVPFTSPSR